MRTRDIFRTGGPHGIRRTGRNTYTISTPLPVNSDGRFSRQCPESTCSPGFFNLRSGTGLTGDDCTVCVCPYCGHRDDPQAFTTKNQEKFYESIIEREARQGMNRLAKAALGLDSFGRRRFGQRGGLFSVEVSYKSDPLPPLRRLADGPLRRDLTCGHCGLEHAVFGLATWCPDCGRDIFRAHLLAETETVKRVLADVAAREERLGGRVAARDTDNALEDTVSIFEGVLRLLTRRALLTRLPPAEFDAALKKIGNGFQNLARAEQLVRDHLHVGLFDSVEGAAVERVGVLFESRHLITHNLGVIDSRFVEKAQPFAAVGREVLVRPADVEQALQFVESVVTSLHERLFPPPAASA